MTNPTTTEDPAHGLPGGNGRHGRWRFAERLVARRRAVLAAVLLAVVLLTVARLLAGGALTGGGNSPTGAESQRASRLLEERFGVRPAGVVLVVEAAGGDVDDAPTAAAARALAGRLAAEPGVTSVTSYWDTGTPSLRSADGRYGLALATLSEDDEAERASRAGELADAYRTTAGPLRVGVTGADVVNDETSHRVERDLLRAEMIAFPVVLLLLILFLRRFLLALVPVGVGLLAVVAAINVVGLVAAVASMSTFTTNITVGLGLGLTIDYTLLLITRYREELAATGDTARALVRSVGTAGRTIGFSAATVAVSLIGLAMFPIPFLRSMALAGVVATLLAALFSTLAIPALLDALGDRVLARRVRRNPDDLGFWYRCAVAVMRVPVLVAGGVVALLLALAVPLGGLSLGVSDDRNLPAGSEARQPAEVLRTSFDGRETSPLRVVAADVPQVAGRMSEVAAYAADLSRVDGAARVDAPDGSYVDGRRVPGSEPAQPRQVTRDGVYLAVVPAVEPVSAAGRDLVGDLRAVPAPFPTLTGGSAADLVDTNEALTSRIPLVGGFIAVVTMVALFLMAGSLLVPVQALALNMLSLSATFGVLVWVFQDGSLSGVLDFTATGSIPSGIPVLVFCVAFGVSMDYAVFLLSRIKEEYERSGDPVGSIATGLGHTGRIVTFAALLLATVFAGFVTSSITAVKLLGLGLTLAVLLDAYVVRGLLVPALMKLGGHANWWAPGPLRRLHDRFGLRELPARREADARAAAAVDVEAVREADRQAEMAADDEPAVGIGAGVGRDGRASR